MSMGGVMKEEKTTMNTMYRNLEEYSCVVSAWRLARWANHAWGLIAGEQLAEVWNLCPSLKAFCDFLPGYAVARGWIAEGPAGYGVVGPRFDDGGLLVYIGSNAQVTARFKPGETVVRYEHGDRFAQASVAAGLVVGAEGHRAEPRDWARVARLLVIAEEPTDLHAAAIREAMRNMAGDEPAAQAEFDKYFALLGPEILAGPEVMAGVM
jgi:hypothetical protein